MRELPEKHEEGGKGEESGDEGAGFGWKSGNEVQRKAHFNDNILA